MTVLSVLNPTLADWMKRQDPQGGVAAVGELLNTTNEVLDYETFLEANQPIGHLVTVRTGLPTVYWRQFNEGTPPSKSTTAQVTEPIGMLEARSEVDADLARLNGDVAAFRMSEERPFIEAMSQEQARTLFYGNPATSPKEYLGLSARYSSLSAGNAQNIIDGADGTASGAVHTSVWLIVWGPETVFCTFPKAFPAGLSHRDLNEQTIQSQNGVAGARMQAFCALYQWKHGFVVKDWRYAVRIANVQVASLRTLATKQAPTAYTNILHMMMLAIDRVPNISLGRAMFCCNRTVQAGIRRLGLEKSGVGITFDSAANQFGTVRKGMQFMGIPIAQCDALLNTESPVA